MTDIELLEMNPGDKVVYNGKVYKVCFVHSVRHRTEMACAKIRRGNEIIYTVFSDMMEKV